MFKKHSKTGSCGKDGIKRKGGLRTNVKTGRSIYLKWPFDLQDIYFLWGQVLDCIFKYLRHFFADLGFWIHGCFGNAHLGVLGALLFAQLFVDRTSISVADRPDHRPAGSPFDVLRTSRGVFFAMASAPLKSFRGFAVAAGSCADGLKTSKNHMKGPGKYHFRSFISKDA